MNITQGRMKKVKPTKPGKGKPDKLGKKPPIGPPPWPPLDLPDPPETGWCIGADQN